MINEKQYNVIIILACLFWTVKYLGKKWKNSASLLSSASTSMYRLNLTV